MISLQVIVIILSLHFIADFILQSDWMAQNKSKDNTALAVHGAAYTSVLLIPSLFLGGWWVIWSLLNGLLHIVVDYFTSRWSSYLWTDKQVHNFFVVIGLDQLIHTIILFITYQLLIGS